jgi:hypothetical protein
MEENKKKYSLGSVDGRIDYAMDFFTERGFTRQAAAGIVGNLLAESGINPKSEQYGGGPGRGIAQWSVDQRWQTYLKFANNRNLDPLDLDAQLRFIIHEMPSAMGESAKTIKTMTDEKAAAKLFMDLYERPGKPNWDRRVEETTRALRSSLAVGSVKNDRGSLTRADDKRFSPEPQQIIIREAKEFFDRLVPDTVQNITEGTLTQARQFFDNLFPKTKDTTPQESQPKFVDRNELQAL